MKNYKYCLAYLKEYVVLHKTLNEKDIKRNFIEKYGEIQFEFTKEERKDILDRYNKENNDKEISDDVDINTIINLDKQIKTAIRYSNHILIGKKNLHQNLIEMKDVNSFNIVTHLNVSFKRNNKNFNKSIYIIQDQYMIENMNNKNITQYFSDCTYYCVPPQSKGMKLFVLIGYDNIQSKSIILLLALIKNENKETIDVILEYLINKYQFNPPLLTCDMARGCIKSFIEKFDNINIYICFFHFISRIIKHLPQIKSKNLNTKKKLKKY